MFEKLKPLEVQRAGASYSQQRDDRNFVSHLHSSRNAPVTDWEGLLPAALMNLFSRLAASPRCFKYVLTWRCLHISLFYRNQELVLCYHSVTDPLPQQSSNALLASSFITSLRTDALRIACPYS